MGARVGSGDIRSRQWWCRVGWRVQTARGARPPPPRSRAGAQLHLPPTLPRPHPHVLPHLSLPILLHPLPPHTYLPYLILNSQVSFILLFHSPSFSLLSPTFRSFSQLKVRIYSYPKTLSRHDRICLSLPLFQIRFKSNFHISGPSFSKTQDHFLISNCILHLSHL